MLGCDLDQKSSEVAINRTNPVLFQDQVVDIKKRHF